MANYYSDHPEIAFHLDHPLMKRVVELKEKSFEDAANYDDAPVNYEDASACLTLKVILQQIS